MMKKARPLVAVDIASPAVGSTGSWDAILATTAMPPDEVIRLVHEGGVQHIVQNDSLSFDTEMAVARLMLEKPHAFLDDPTAAILGLLPDTDPTPSASSLSSPSLSPTLSSSSSFLKIESAASEKKTAVLERFENFLAELPGARTIRESSILVADELYTNGSKNCWPPRGGPGEGPVREGRIEFFARSDGRRLVIGCLDTYGELVLPEVLARIRSCYERGVAESINQGGGGAGIGSFMVFDHCISYYAGVEPGERTVVCAALPLGLSRRELEKLTKNIHLLSVVRGGAK